MNTETVSKIKWKALAVLASILAVLALYWSSESGKQTRPTTNEPVRQGDESVTENDRLETREIQPPDGSRAVPIELNIDDTSHAIICSGDRMDVIELEIDDARRDYRVLATNAMISKTDYDRRHPLIHVILARRTCRSG